MAKDGMDLLGATANTSSKMAAFDHEEAFMPSVAIDQANNTAVEKALAMKEVVQATFIIDRKISNMREAVVGGVRS